MFAIQTEVDLPYVDMCFGIIGQTMLRIMGMDYIVRSPTSVRNFISNLGWVSRQ